MPRGSSDPEKSRPGRPQGRPGFFVSGSDGSGPEQAVDEGLPKVGLKHTANLATEGGGDGHLVFEAFLEPLPLRMRTINPAANCGMQRRRNLVYYLHGAGAGAGAGGGAGTRDDAGAGASAGAGGGRGARVTDDRGCCLVAVFGMVPHQSPMRR